MAAYVVWDWNGTLFDDVALCIQVMNGMLEKRGLPRLAGPEQYRQVFTFPVEEYYKEPWASIFPGSPSPSWRWSTSPSTTAGPWAAPCAPGRRPPWRNCGAGV